MPWPSRLLSPTGTQNRNSPQQQREKPLPPPPPAAGDGYDPPPTLHPDRVRSSPPRTRPAGPSGAHRHNRSVSHPLPNIFKRKKSSTRLNGEVNEEDISLDESLVPVLDGGADAAPTRVISGKRAPLDEGDKVTRKCMCCDARVSVPKDVERFRCMQCVTINDLKPKEQQMAEKDKSNGKNAEVQPGSRSNGLKAMPISIDRTRSIIDSCIMSYLEARCRRQVGAAPPQILTRDVASKKADTPTEEGLDNSDLQDYMHAQQVLERREEQSEPAKSKQLLDAPMAYSPPDTPRTAESMCAPSATIRSFADIDLFSYMRSDTPPTEKQCPLEGSGPPAPSAQLSSRKPVPTPPKPGRKPPPPPVNIGTRTPSQRLQPTGIIPNGQRSPRPLPSPRLPPEEIERQKHYDRVKTIFKPLEDYLLRSYGDWECMNTSFSTVRPVATGRTRSESNIATPPSELRETTQASPGMMDMFEDLDAKLLLLGDIGENGSWWTGKLDRSQREKSLKRKKVGEGTRRPVTSKTPNINWTELAAWYELVHTAGDDWLKRSARVKSDATGFNRANIEGPVNIDNITEDFAEAREHAVRALLKMMENVVKRPGRPLKEPEDLRFLLIMLFNPSLYPSKLRLRKPPPELVRKVSRKLSGRHNGSSSPKQGSPGKAHSIEGSKHTGIIKRIFGLVANTPETCHRYLIGWFMRFDEEHFVQMVDLVSSFVTHRISRSANRPRSRSGLNDGGLIPDFSSGAASTSAQLHSAMGLSGSVKKRQDEVDNETDWASDWQVKGAAKVMSLLFAANNSWQGKPRNSSVAYESGFAKPNAVPYANAKRSGQLLHTSSFYNTLLDYNDLVADFKVWETRRDKFAFCQYPLFLSMGAKIKVLEYDARRQMELKAREAYFDNVIRQRAIDGYFHLRVRRDCVADDSFRQISEASGAGTDEFKKGLRVHFQDEEGVDAGGPRKEWFLMIVREMFDPNHGIFVYDDESNTCYFNPDSFENSQQYYFVGALLGLAIYNSTILDVALPPFAFRKLLAAAPSGSTANANLSSLTGTKGQMTYTLADLAEYKPSLAAGLQQLLDFEGDVEATYCRDFVAPVERYGVVRNEPLISNGEATPVTNANRHEFVDTYVRYLLDTAVSRQFEPFKRGFFNVCAGNALSLFRAEEIELLIRGSDEALDVNSLKAVAVYENWKHPAPPHTLLPAPTETVPVIAWFWQAFAQADPQKQRKLLSFITGSDRIPAVGATSLVLKIVAGGDGWGGGRRDERARFPIARTCFNMLVLWHYDTREQLEGKLWRAVEDSEGFGLK